LIELEREFPELATADSPSQRRGRQAVGQVQVGPAPHADDEPGQHLLAGGGRAFVERVQRLVPDEKLEWVVEPKIDGVAINLRYEQGLFTLGATRGDARRAMTSRRI